MSRWVTRFVEHRDAFAGSMSIPTRVPIGREKVCDCGETLANLEDEQCPSCIRARIHSGEMIAPHTFGSVQLGAGVPHFDPDLRHLTSPILDRCRYCGTKNPCSSNRCPSCGAPV